MKSDLIDIRLEIQRSIRYLNSRNNDVTIAEYKQEFGNILLLVENKIKFY